jgi:hypothetical protein
MGWRCRCKQTGLARREPERACRSHAISVRILGVDYREKNSRPALGLVRHGRLSGLRLGRGQAAVTRSSPLRNTHASSGWQEVEFVRIYRIHTEALTSQFSSIQKIGSDDCAIAKVGLTNLPRELGLNIDFVRLLSKATKTLHQD